MDSLYLYFSWKRNKRVSSPNSRLSVDRYHPSLQCTTSRGVEKGDFSVVMVGRVMGWERLFKGGVV